MIFQILDKKGKVTNTIAADLSFMQAQYPDGNYQEVATEPEAVPAVNRYITKLAFLTRFTDAEAIAIDMVSVGTTVEAAAMRRYMKKVDAATFIDLDSADTRAGVIALESLGLLDAGRALQILDAEIQPNEVSKG